MLRSGSTAGVDAGCGQAPPCPHRHRIAASPRGRCAGVTSAMPGDSAGGNRERLASGEAGSAGRLRPQHDAHLAGGRMGSGQGSQQSRSSHLCPGTHAPSSPRTSQSCSAERAAGGGIPRAHPGHLGRASYSQQSPVLVMGGTRCPQAGWGSQRCRRAGGGGLWVVWGAPRGNGTRAGLRHLPSLQWERGAPPMGELQAKGGFPRSAVLCRWGRVSGNRAVGGARGAAGQGWGTCPWCTLAACRQPAGPGWSAAPRDWPSPTANSTELGRPTPGLGKEGLPRTQGQRSRGRPGCASALSPSCWLPRHSPSASTVGTYTGSCSLLPAPGSAPAAPRLLPGCGAGGSVPLTPPGSTGQGGAASSAWWRGSRGWECWGVPGAWPCAGSGRGRLGLFSSLFARPWGRPVMRIKAGVPRAANCRPARRGGRGAAAPGLSQPWRGPPCQRCLA